MLLLGASQILSHCNAPDFAFSPPISFLLSGRKIASREIFKAKRKYRSLISGQAGWRRDSCRWGGQCPTLQEVVLLLMIVVELLGFNFFPYTGNDAF